MTTQLDHNEVFAFMQAFPVDFLNNKNELIIDDTTDTFVSINGCTSIEDVKARVVYAMCRPIGKGLETYQAERLLKRLNHYFGTELTRNDMRRMYGELCYPHMLDTLKRFIDRGFPVAELTPQSFYDHPPVR